VSVFQKTFNKHKEQQMRIHRIATMGGDGIGPEVVAAGVQALKACAERDGQFKLDFQDFDWGSDYYKKHGVMMPADGADQLRKFDAILFGSVGAPDIPDHITLWGLRLAICQPLDQYANVRPTRILPGITSPLRNVSGPELDWVIVRENSEGEYSGVGGRVHKGLPEEVATDVSIMTRPGVVRIIRFAFKLARKGIANPVATFWTAAMMLEHLGEKPAADRLMKAVERVTANKSLHTPDLGGKATTKQVTDSVCEALRSAND
jgi:isocitrate/isopropylmalate dehydrogenase